MIRLYHNPRCSKSREALELLTANGAEVEVVDYLKTPFSHAELKQVLECLGMSARELLRTKEEEYKSLRLDDVALEEKHLIDAMISHPKLIERPIAVKGAAAVIGRPPEKVLALL